MSDEKKSEPSFQIIRIERIDSAPFQIRQTIDEDALRALASSMQHVGLLQPILVRPKGERMEVVAGERRFRAAKLLGWASIPCQVQELSDLEAALRQVIENDQRVDANPLERARAFAHLRDAFQLAQDQIAMRVGVHKSVVSRALALLEQPKEIQQMLADERLSPTHLRLLDEIADHSKRIEVAAEVATHRLSTRQTEERAHKAAKTVKAKARDGGETTWMDEVSDWIGGVHKALGELKVVWHFFKSVLELLGRLIPGHERAPKKRFAARSASPRSELPAETETHEQAAEPSPPA